MMHAEGEMITEWPHSYLPRLRQRSLAASGWESMVGALTLMERAHRLGGTTAAAACQVGDFVGHG